MSNLPISNMEQFKKQIDNPKQVISDNTNQNVVKVRKNLIIAYQSDQGGCGNIRTGIPMSYINSAFGRGGRLNISLTTFFIFQPEVLVNVRSIWFQRMMDPKQLERVSEYKRIQEQFKFKMIYDLDDNIYGHNELQGGNKQDGVPSYNFGSEKIDDIIKSTSIKIMNLMDTVCTSTDYLGNILKNNGVTVPIKTVYNTIPLFFYGNKKKEPIKEKITKPRIIYTGSPTHYHNGKELLGDWENNWLEYITKSVIDNKIDFICMGGCPFFFENIKGRSNFKIIEWHPFYNYHLPLLDFKADFSIGPLVINQFNRAKSDIKAIESYASGSLFIGTIFNDKTPSPYDNCFLKLYNDCSVKDIQTIIEEYSYPEKYNDVMNKQYQYLLNEGRYTESPKFINNLLSII